MKRILFVWLLFYGFNFKAQLLINEISSSCNTVVIVDDNNNSSDWIEIYNPTASPVNASGFFITNSLSSPLKWQLPNVNIPASGFMRVYCSGENRINGLFYHSNFKLERAGETVFIFNAGANLIDSRVFGNLELNHSFGRSPDGAANWFYFTTPSPGSSNIGTLYTAYCNDVVFSVNQGFYPAAQSLTLTCVGFDIRYTTNGSEPTVVSTLYSAPLSINTTSLVKAKSFPIAGSVLPGKTITKSIFINETQLGYLPIVSISMNQASFNAMYNPGNPNYPAQISHLEYFKNKNVFLFETDFDLSPHGTTSYNLWPQKGLRVTCKSEYNIPKIKDTLFHWDNKKLLKKFDGFNLRHDYGGGGIWDGLPTQISRQNTNMDYTAYQPVSVFINGNYWGEYQMREKGDNDFVESNYPTVSKDSIDMLHQTNSSGNLLVAMCGSDTGFVTAANHIYTVTPSSQQFYDFFKSKFDVKNFFDYYVAEIYTGNADWISPVNNYKVWRSQKPGSKWRYLFFDGDYAYGFQFVTHNLFPNLLTPPAGNPHARIFACVMQNPTHKNYFINRFADLLNTIYLPNVAQVVSSSYRDSLIPVIQRHIARWGNTTYSNWLNLFPTYFSTSWFTNRATNIRGHIQAAFTLTAQVSTTFQVFPANAGNVLLNTIEPTVYPWTGIYFNGAPITVKSKAAPSYMFDHWESTDLGVFNTTDSNTVNLNSAQIIKLYFVACPIPPTATNVTSMANQTVCINNSATLSAVGSGTVSWYASLGSTVSIGTGTTFVTPILNPAGTYTYYAENFKCISGARTQIIVSALSCVSLNELYASLSQLKIYPNPTNKTLNIDIENPDLNTVLILRNLIGQTVLTQSINENKTPIDVEHLSPGMYFAVLRKNGIEISKKIIIERQ